MLRRLNIHDTKVELHEPGLGDGDLYLDVLSHWSTLIGCQNVSERFKKVPESCESYLFITVVKRSMSICINGVVFIMQIGTSNYFMYSQT